MHLQSPAHSAPPQRERFASPLVALAMFCAFVAVLALLFPERGLLGVLENGDDAAAIRYREALLRVRPGDTPLRLRVAGSLLRSGHPGRALETLEPLSGPLSPEQAAAVDELRYGALQSLFSQAKSGDSHWQALRPRVTAAARALAGPHPPAWRLQQLATDAQAAGDLQTWQLYRQQLERPVPPPPTAAPPRDPVATALAKGDYRAAAALCFERMQRADSISRRRTLYMQGVRTLQQGNLPLEALDAGERYLGQLRGDRETLMFLTRVGLAANRPERAQAIIRKALGMDRGEAGPS